MTNHPNRLSIATIRHNDARISRRVHLYIRRSPAGYGIFTGSGEDAGNYRFASRHDALAAIGTLWAGPEWCLQFRAGA